MRLQMRTVKALPVLILLITLSSVRAQEKKLGVFEGKDDVGNPARVGNAVYDPEKQEYLVEGAGTNMWANRDEFQFVWRRLKGNFILTSTA